MVIEIVLGGRNACSSVGSDLGTSSNEAMVPEALNKRLEFDDSSWAYVTDANPPVSDPNLGLVKNIQREFRAGNFLVPKILSSDVRRVIVLLASGASLLELTKAKTHHWCA